MNHLNLFDQDLILTIIDDNRQLVIGVNRSLLRSSCPYFEKLLTNFKEKNLNEITIKVPNASITKDIIMIFYKKIITDNNHWSYQLDKIKCLDFLGLPYEDHLLTIKVPLEGFDQLIYFIDSHGYTGDRVRLIYNSIPKNYHPENFSEELINIFKSLEKSQIIITGIEKNIKIWCSETGQLIKKFDETDASHQNIIMTVCATHDNISMVSGGMDGTIKIWDIASGLLVRTLDGHQQWVSSINISNDDTLIVSCDWGGNVKIWDLITGNLTGIPTDEQIRCTALTTDHKLIMGTSSGKISIYDLGKNILEKTFTKYHTQLETIIITSDNKYIISANGLGNIYCWLIYNPSEMIYEFNVGKMSSICLSINNKKLISANHDGIINVWNLDQIIYNHQNNIFYDIADCKILSIKSEHGWVYGVNVSSANNRIIANTVNHICIWDLDTGDFLHCLDEELDNPIGLAVGNFIL